MSTAPIPSGDAPMSPTKFTEDFGEKHQFPGPAHTDTVDTTNTAAAATTSKDEADIPRRHSTLKKKSSIGRGNSLKRSGSQKSWRSRRSSIYSGPGEGAEDYNSVFHTPIPTTSNPTEILVNRFNSWRRVLKDFITYFKEVQVSYEARARGITKITHSLHGSAQPAEFAETGGIMETMNVLRDFHKEAYVNSESAAKIETEVINNLVGLRSDLNLKMKEIKALSGDFKNNVDKEKEGTRKEILKLQDALTALDSSPENAKGKSDPYLLRLAVEKQLARQLAEENYLHRAYLNLESSGRELEKIVVGEIQKAFDTYVKIVRREGEDLFDMADRLTNSTLRLPQDYEWSQFVEKDPKMVNPAIPLRQADQIEYPGLHHPAATQIREGMLERKSKYLKSFTPGWYVLSATHLHEFKSPERTKDQQPVMSLYLPESSLGKHSDPHATSQKFVLKGKQTGIMHRGHSWVFRAETHAAMLEWYEDIKKLTEASNGAERNAVVAASVSRSNTVTHHEGDDYSDLDNDEADEIPYSGEPSALAAVEDDNAPLVAPPRRPEGGRFPSDIQVNRGLENKRSSSGDSLRSTEAIAAAGALPGSRSYPDGQAESSFASGETPYPQESHFPLEQSYVVVPREQERSNVTNIDSQPGAALTAQEYAGREPIYDEKYPQGDTDPISPIHRHAPYETAGHYPQAGHEQYTQTSVADSLPQSTITDSYPTPSNIADSGSYAQAQPGHTSINPIIVGTSGLGRSDTTASKMTDRGIGTDPVNVSPIETTTTTTGTGTESARPELEGTRGESKNTVSDLKIPGNYPKGQ